jgi:hypothetical protein
MKGLVEASESAGTSSAVAAPDRKTEDVARAAHMSGGTGLSFDDLRVGLTGKVTARVGPAEVSAWMAENSTCNPGPDSNKGCK